jgi:3'(2'), 5'-bisphosphate nucleotidase
MALGQNYNKKLIFRALRDAGDAILSIESGTFSIRSKSDNSPVTDADLVSDSIIRKALREISPDIPVASEEHSFNIHDDIIPAKFWLLDPLDGTKEFIKGNGEYCISLALIVNKRPAEAYIYAPSLKKMWFAAKNSGAFVTDSETTARLPLLNPAKNEALVLLRSRSHHNSAELEWYREASRSDTIRVKKQGSVLKFCMIAEGKADLYIKKGRIFGWDIAAGDLILKESGGLVLAYGTEMEILYKFDTSEMPFFVACGPRIKKPEQWLL